MAKLPRKNMKVFGSGASGTQLGIFGSLAAGSPAYSNDPEVIQSLAAWNNGWFSAIIGDANPAIEDMNSQLFVYAYQLAYIFQSGIPEWKSDTTYYVGSVAQDGLGNFYISLSDDNLNQPITNPSHWRNTRNPIIDPVNPLIENPFTLGPGDTGKTFLVTTATGVMQFTLPVAILGYQFKIIDTSGQASVNNITVVRNGSELIQGLGASYICKSDYGVWTFVCDGTNWNLA